MLNAKRTIVIVLIIVLGVVAIGVLCAPSTLSRKVRTIQHENIVHKRFDLLEQYMDRTADPCEDFFQFACGNFEKIFDIPADKSSFGIIQNMENSIEHNFKDLIDEIPVDSEELSPVTKLKVFYDSCMDTESIENLGSAPLLNAIKNIGKWPALDSTWSEEEFDWIYVMVKMGNVSAQPFIEYTVYQDEKLPEFDSLYLGSGSVNSMPRTFYIGDRDSKQLLAYEQFAKDVMILLGVDESVADKTVKDVIELEIELEKLKLDLHESSDHVGTFNRFTVAELYGICSDIDWERFLNLALPTPINETSKVIVKSKRYFDGLCNIVRDTSRRRSLANFMFLKFAIFFINNLDQKFDKIFNDFQKVVEGSEKRPDRWKVCLSDIKNYFDDNLSRLFLEKFFDKKSKKDVMDIVAQLQQSFREIINDSDWVTDEFRMKIFEKSDYMKYQIGYSDYLLAEEGLKDEFTEVEVNSDTYFDNILSLWSNQMRIDLEKRDQIYDNRKWDLSATTVNAIYVLSNNALQFPAAILQFPIYNRHFPSFLRYAPMGSVLAHEITHAYDQGGQHFDKDGKLGKWYPSEMTEAFKEHAKCFEDQYSGYSMEGHQLNGTTTVTENIADFEGLRTSFRAFKNLSNELTDNETLPPLKLTREQLFFVSYTQFWCETIRPEAILNTIINDRHIPKKYRVIGTLSNSYDFAREYQCAEGTQMNPIKKCKIW